MTFLFWNVERKPVPDLVKQIVDDHRVDIVTIAEPPAETPWLLGSLTDFQQVMLASRLQLFTRTPGAIKVVHEDRHYSIAAIRPKGPELLFAVAHLPSKLHADSMDQAYAVRAFANDIREQESKHGHRRTLVMGDLNANPFEEAITAADGLHGVMTQALARPGDRVYQQKRFPFFYNPMWSRMGDLSPGPPGTWFKRESNLSAAFWHTFDQCLLRPDLLSSFAGDRFQVLDRAGPVPLATERQVARGELPDHLPILLELKF